MLRLINPPRKILVVFLLFPLASNASFIESTMGTAVVDDATATYHNPAALTLIKNPQIIMLGTRAQFNNQFTGKVTQSATGFTQSGTANSQTNYFLPSGYFGAPVSDKLFLGIAVLANNFNRDSEQNSILRYVMSNNNIQDIDLVPAIGFKLNEYLSIGAGLNFSQANFLFKPIAGFPSLNIPDSQSRNDASSHAWGGDVGLLLKPRMSTLIGLNYRSSMTYQFNGTSVLEGNPGIISDHYSFNFWTPARYVLSINQFLSRDLGLIGTLQWVKWDNFDKINIHGIATQIGPDPVILPSVTVPLHLHNSLIYTVGGYYRLTPKWVIRSAGSYLQSPGNGNYQISNGDNVILGASVGYKISKTITLDGGYAHAFIQNQDISIHNPVNIISGVNKGSRDSLSLKLIINI